MAALYFNIFWHNFWLFATNRAREWEVENWISFLISEVCMGNLILSSQCENAPSGCIVSEMNSSWPYQLFTGSYEPTGDKCLILERLWVEYQCDFYWGLLKQQRVLHLQQLNLTTRRCRPDSFNNLPWKYDWKCFPVLQNNYKWLKVPEVSWATNKQKGQITHRSLTLIEPSRVCRVEELHHV